MDTQKVTAEYRLLHWMKVIQERQNSGQNIKEFCQATGISDYFAFSEPQVQFFRTTGTRSRNHLFTYQYRPEGRYPIDLFFENLMLREMPPHV